MKKIPNLNTKQKFNKLTTGNWQLVWGIIGFAVSMSNAKQQLNESLAFNTQLTSIYLSTMATSPLYAILTIVQHRVEITN